MKNLTVFKWYIEHLDEANDICDIDFSENLSDLTIPKTPHNLCLVRRTYNSDTGKFKEYYAYVKNNELPLYFINENGNETKIKVPEKYKKELHFFFNK